MSKVLPCPLCGTRPHIRPGNTQGEFEAAHHCHVGVIVTRAEHVPYWKGADRAAQGWNAAVRKTLQFKEGS